MYHFDFNYIIYFWRYSKNKNNNNFYKKTKITIEDEFIIGNFEDGSDSKLNLNNIIKIIKILNYYLLYVSNNNFIIIPLMAFNNNEDLDIFINFLKTKSLISR